MSVGEKGKRKWLFRLATAAMVVAVCALFLGGNYYIDRMRQSLWTQSVTDVLEITEQGSHAFEVYVRQGYAMLEGRASNFSQYESSDEKSILKKLDLYEGGDPTFVVMDLTHKVIYFNSSERTALSEEEVETYRAFPEQGVMAPYISEYTGQKMFGYYERFTFADGAEGLVRKGHLLSEVAEEFSLSFFDDTGFSYVIDGDGDIVLRPDNPNSNRTFSNIYDVLQVEGNTDDSEDDLRDGMASGKEGAMEMLFDDRECVLTFTPVNEVEGWYVISVIPSASIMTRTEQILKTSQSFIFVIGLVLFLVFLIAAVTWGYRKLIKEKVTDVTYREQLFGVLAGNTDEAFLMLSVDSFSVEYVSPNIERILGISQQTAAEDGLSVLNAVVENVGYPINEEELRNIPLGESRTFEGKYTQEETRKERWMEVKVYHFSIDRRERFIVVFSDRTEDREKEAALTDALDIAQTANQSKSAFLSNMSHDIRTPMNAIVGLSTLLQRDADKPEKVREHTRKITTSSQHLLGLINDVLDMSKIESGKTTLSIGEFNLAEIVEEMVTIMRSQAKARRQEFEVYVKNLTDEQVLGDKNRISQVLLNILSNAVKYTPEGGRVEMTVRQIPYRMKGFAHFQFQVEDNGIGMDSEYMKTIFDPFSRSQESLSSGIQGSGLGMAITKNLVELMGGSIGVKSELGKGSIFTVDLELQIQKQRPDEDFWQEYGIHNALIVDDEVDICTEVMAAMANTDVSMQFALDGETAVQMVEHACMAGQDFNIILLDWRMPGMDGLETARRIRGIVSKNVPIMILTSYDYSEIEKEGYEAGIDAFLPKPFFLSTFKEVIRSLKDKKKLENRVGDHTAILRGKRFMAAEDNELNAEILVELLSMMGVECEIATDGKEALAMFEASAPGEFDAILMDIQMPVMDGYEATRAIRASAHPMAKTIPIIAMTANAFADDVEHALNAGMDAHLAKPVDMEKLEEILKKVFLDREGSDGP